MSGKWLQAVDDLARVTGAAAMARFGGPIAVETKADGSPVSAADRDAETVARAWIRERFPEDGILGEEHGEERPGARRRWILDPIDGTKAFIRGVPLWGTMIAVAEGDDVLAGALFFPATGELIAAEKGAGCFVNGARVRVSATARLSDATALTSDARLRHDGLDRVFARSKVARTWGDAYGYFLVASGRADVMLDPVLNPWDTAPLLPILEEAGGLLTDMAGRRTAFGGSAVATNAALGAEVRQLLAMTPAPGVSLASSLDLDALDFTKSAGLVTVVAQDARTGEVLMVAHADREALEKTIATGEMHYRSRTRGLWKKGETSGNVQRVVALAPDCDGDAVLARVIPAGPACHTGDRTCFPSAPPGDALSALDHTIAQRAAGSGDDKSWTKKLLADRNLRLKKLGEESAELVLALGDGDSSRAVEEAADLVYHTLVALRPLGLSLDDVRAALTARAAPSSRRSPR